MWEWKLGASSQGGTRCLRQHGVWGGGAAVVRGLRAKEHLGSVMKVPPAGLDIGYWISDASRMRVKESSQQA